MEKKKLGLFSLIALGVGGTIGSGIFTMLPTVVGFTGRSVCLAMVMATAIAAASVMPTVFISSVVDLNGGIYSQHLALFPPVLAGVFGIMQMISYIGFAPYLLGLAGYTIQLIPGLSGMEKALALLYLLIFFLLGVKGIGLSSKVQNIMVVILLVALGCFAFGGLPSIQPGVFSQEGFFTGGAKGFITAACMLSMSAMGAQCSVNFASETKNPKKTIPLSIVLTFAVILVFYFLIAVVTVGVVPVEEVAGKNLGVAAEVFMSKPVYLFFLIGGALFALGTSLNGTIMALPAPWLKMTEDGWLPKILLKKDKKFNYPYVLMGIMLMVGGILPLVLDWDFATIVSAFTFPLFLVSTIAAIASLRIPTIYKEKWENSMFCIPKGIFYVIMILSCVCNALIAYTYMAYLTTATLIGAFVGMGIILCYAVWKYKSGQVNIEALQ